jgi:hypothetical protein
MLVQQTGVCKALQGYPILELPLWKPVLQMAGSQFAGQIGYILGGRDYEKDVVCL